MSQAEVQAQLNDFYRQRIQALKDAQAFSESEQKQLSAPFLINVEQSYLESPVKIMFVGKETNGWWGKLSDCYGAGDPIGVLTRRYLQQFHKDNWKGNFLQQYKRVSQELTSGMRGAVLWNNLLKMDFAQGKGYSRNSKDYSSALMEFSKDLIRFETELLKPDVIIFACSYTYDDVIKNHFREYVTEKVIERHSLWTFKIGTAMCYRTWHPQTIKYVADREIPEYYDEIISDIKARFPANYSAAKP